MHGSTSVVDTRGRPRCGTSEALSIAALRFRRVLGSSIDLETLDNDECAFSPSINHDGPGHVNTNFGVDCSLPTVFLLFCKVTWPLLICLGQHFAKCLSPTLRWAVILPSAFLLALSICASLPRDAGKSIETAWRRFCSQSRRWMGIR
ncbi:hypothetical protein BRADI_3g09398v3 [Brachypodium distachyon]|uniref:Uncharacterized protein n=1 Tax=Brachypodium distachyon TaxID=15368 RepID=A0A0Q3F444_BRADI|nr:hypothetical protein BRADI_3g09398v3 [Brachypodium distachyon]